MLVLSRRKSECIIIDDHITLTVVDVYRDCVRLGISAPADIKIDRKEVYDAKERSRKKIRTKCPTFIEIPLVTHSVEENV